MQLNIKIKLSNALHRSCKAIGSICYIQKHVQFKIVTLDYYNNDEEIHKKCSRTQVAFADNTMDRQLCELTLFIIITQNTLLETKSASLSCTQQYNNLQ